MRPSSNDIRIRSLAERKNLVKREDFAEVLPPVDGFGPWFRSLPDIYGGTNLKRIVDLIVKARVAGKASASANQTFSNVDSRRLSEAGLQVGGYAADGQCAH